MKLLKNAKITIHNLLFCVQKKRKETQRTMGWSSIKELEHMWRTRWVKETTSFPTRLTEHQSEERLKTTADPANKNMLLMNHTLDYQNVNIMMLQMIPWPPEPSRSWETCVSGMFHEEPADIWDTKQHPLWCPYEGILNFEAFLRDHITQYNNRGIQWVSNTRNMK